MSMFSLLKKSGSYSLMAAFFAAFVMSAALTPASAQSLNDLRASGQIGEAFDGFARARDGSVKATVQSINTKRRSIYSDRAKQQGTSIEQVGKIYAAQIIAKAAPGTWLLMQNGSWKQK